MKLDKDEVLAYLPHRDPFLFIDTVEDVVIPEELKTKLDAGEEITSRDLVGTKVIANYEIKEDMPVLKGHFPGNPILPGVLQVEMMAQAGAFVSIALDLKNRNDLEVDTLLLAVDKSKFRKPLGPGAQLRIETTMKKCRGNIATYECLINDETGDKASEATFMAKLDMRKKG